MRDYDREDTNPIVLVEELQMARGTRDAFVKKLGPALVTGDWLISPSGVKGYIAGRSPDNEGTWIFVIKSSKDAAWPTGVVEMMGDSFIGFRPYVEEKKNARPNDNEGV